MIEDIIKISNIDWCEVNNDVTEYLKEFYNCITMLPMIIISIYGIYKTIYRYNYLKCESKYNYKTKYIINLYILLLFIGVGSFLFHGYLNNITQSMDELSMIYFISYIIYILNKIYYKLKKREFLFKTYFYVYLFCVTFLYFKSGYFHLFIIIFVSVSITLIYYTCVLNTFFIKNKNYKYALTSFSFGLGLWLIEIYECTNYYLHAWWHIFVTFGGYYIIKSIEDYLIELKIIK